MSPREGIVRRCPLRRAGLTLVELLLAVSIMSIMAGMLGALAMAVQTSFEYSQGNGDAVQHARVNLDRISRLIAEATATAEYPGVVVAYEDYGAWRFPDTLVIWHPTGDPANAAGPPLISELIIICPDPANPNRLIEATLPTDNRPVPASYAQDPASWYPILRALVGTSAARKTVLTNLMRASSATAVPGPATSATRLRGAVRFERELRPSAADWTRFTQGTLAWNNLAWPQGIYGTQTGLRQVWVRTELQLMPGEHVLAADTQGQQAIPFLGSGTLHYELKK